MDRKNKQESPLVKLCISAGVTWVFELSIGHCLEFLKIVKQTQVGQSYAQLTKNITRQKGIIGIWDGFFPWGTVQAVAKGSVFGFGHALANGQLNPLVERNHISNSVREILAGGIGGGLQGLVLSPTLLLKTRVMTDPVFRNRMSMLETSKQSAKIGMNVIQKEGLKALMKGSIVFSMKRVADWSTRFMFSEMIEHGLYRRHLHVQATTKTHEKMISSLLGGVLSTVMTLPIDVMVAQIQQASKAGTKVSILSTFQSEFKIGGFQRVAGFATRGFLPRVTHVALTTMLMKTACSTFYEKYQRYNIDST